MLKVSFVMKGGLVYRNDLDPGAKVQTLRSARGGRGSGDE